MRILTGIQPSGTPHIGNYFGAMRQIVASQEKGETFIFLADYHSLTTSPEPEQLRRNVQELALNYLACGVDPQKAILFRQSDVPQVCELCWILNNVTPVGLLERAHSYKDKLAKGFAPNNGLFSYPVLMASDILIYRSDLVPVGKDQKQHLEITRDIAARFNGIYGNVFTVPDAYIPKTGAARVMSLQDPSRKMSKSDPNPKGTIYLTDAPETIMKKFKSAVTDSEMCVRYAEGKDGINNLMTIYSAVTGDSLEKIESDFAGKGYGDFKKAVGEAVVAELEPFQKKYNEIIADKQYLKECQQKGAEKALRVSSRTLGKVMKKVGFLI